MFSREIGRPAKGSVRIGIPYPIKSSDDPDADDLGHGYKPQLGLSFHIVIEILYRFLQEFHRRIAWLNVTPGVFSGPSVQGIQVDVRNPGLNILRDVFNGS
jgi:hypothetical protein